MLYGHLWKQRRMVMVNEGGFSVVILDGEKVNQAYAAAKEIYAQYGVDTENVMEKIRKYRYRCIVGRG